MLTDVFFRRYKGTPLFTSFKEPHRVAMAQTAKIIVDQLFPFHVAGKENEFAKKNLQRIHDALAMEIGVDTLSNEWYQYETGPAGNRETRWAQRTIADIIKNFMNETFGPKYSADNYLKFRISLIEVAFRQREEQNIQANMNLPGQIHNAQQLKPEVRKLLGKLAPTVEALSAENVSLNASFQANVNELNTRFRQADLRLSYHNGFVQIAEDELIGDQLEKPFWALVADPKWKNVDTDMKEALDLRDNDGRDPAFFAARALESTIKLISGQMGVSTGKERSAANFIDNLRSDRAGKFLDGWEAEMLHAFFREVRNPLGHGAGEAPMHTLSGPQTNWAIETCMAWIKNLIQRT